MQSDVINGTERPIAFRSRTLTKPGKNYSQLEKEALALIFGVKFRDYMLCREFTLKTDHEPLVGLFKENRPIPSTAAARIQRWAMTLGAYKYVIWYKLGSRNQNADSLSRLPLPASKVEQEMQDPEQQDSSLVAQVCDTGPLSRKQFEDLTKQDALLQLLLGCIRQGWPKGQLPQHLEALQPYWK